MLRYSVNTWSDGFLDKLYASTDPVGVASDLLLSVLNTNVSSSSGGGRWEKVLMGCRSMCTKVRLCGGGERGDDD